MLLSIEVAVEYWLALTWSPQAQWLNELAKNGIIQDEVCILPLTGSNQLPIGTCMLLQLHLKPAMEMTLSAVHPQL